MAYNAFNSLSPMMFRKNKEKDKLTLEGTRNERWRSKSMENVFDEASPRGKNARAHRGGSLAPKLSSSKKSAPSLHRTWTELSKLKGIGPVVACVLPSLAMDFVASALLAVGATPLITEDPADMIKDLTNCKAVVVDIGAPHVILEAFKENFNRLCPHTVFILVASDCGANDRKKELLVSMLDEVVPTVITGRLGDISAVAQLVIEKNVSPLDSLSDASDVSDEDLCNHIPNVIISRNSVGEKNPTPSSLPPVMRRAKFHKNDKEKNKERESSPHSPRNCSPQISPRSSPSGSPRGAMKLIMKKKKASSGGLRRVPTALPRVHMKGQFRVTQMNDVSVETALENAQKLCAYTSTFVHLYEANVVTSGEVVVEICNNQTGMGNLHSTLACSGAIMAAVLSCVDLEEDEDASGDSISVKHCGHALALYYVAGEVAGSVATHSEKGTVQPGSLKQAFIDALNYLSEEEVHHMVQIFAHSEGLKSCLK